MSIPPNQFPAPQSGGFVPPGTPNANPNQPPPRRGCWLGGFLTCLTLVLIFAALSALGLYKFGKTHIGKTLFGSAYSMSDCMDKMRGAQAAILRCHEHTGSYPAALQDLAPTYIDANALHCSLDKNTDPEHPSFAYKRPPAATSESAAVPVLSFHWRVLIPADSHTTVINDEESIMLLNGTILQNQNQTTETNTGAVLSRKHSGTSLTLGPGSTGV